MKLSNAAAYAARALVCLAGRPPSEPVASHVIAAKAGTPETFMLRVLKQLVSARVLLSVKDQGGGYRLARPAKGVTLLEIVEAEDGPLRAAVPPRDGPGRRRAAPAGGPRRGDRPRAPAADPRDAGGPGGREGHGAEGGGVMGWRGPEGASNRFFALLVVSLLAALGLYMGLCICSKPRTPSKRRGR